MVQAICSAGVVTTFKMTVKEFNNMMTGARFVKDENGWNINTAHIISWIELSEPSSD